MYYTAIERYLLSAPVPNLNLPALIEPTELDLIEREAELGWDREEGVGALLFTLKVNGVLILFCNEILEVVGRRAR